MKKHIILCIITLFLLSTTLFGQQSTSISQRLGDLETPRLIKVACIGNSVTYGYGHENPDSTSYPSQLAVMLGDDYEVGNFGKSGATLLRKGHRPYNEQEEFKKALEFAPDIAIIHLGLNDTDPRNWKYYKKEFISDYIAIIEAFEKVNPNIEIYICRMTPIFHWHHRFKKGTRDWYWEIQETIENIAENIAEVKIIDLQEVLYHRPDLMPDALHPNPEGANLIAQRVYSAITGDFGGLSVPRIYSDNMVIQRGKPFVVKGTADAGTDISVRFNKKTIVTQASDDGKWETVFDAPEVDGKKHKLVIKTKDKTLSFKNIVVGEVVLCSGNYMSTDNGQQSTDFVADFMTKDKSLKAKGNDIRLYYMKAPDDSVITDTNAWKHPLEKAILNSHGIFFPTSWEEFNEEDIDFYSETLYSIGIKISDSLQMPVGLIYNVVEGAPIESFIDRKTLEWHPTLINVLYEWRNADNVKEHLDSNEPSYNYDKHIAPLSSFPINSVIWFEDDSDIDSDLDSIKKSALVESWKKVFGEISFIKM
ncbi:MAG: sialate O-acetylesterase [Bacteroidales bacterium]|nr:sialate O-acetylesterase [Bacteroidales bacterium]